MKKLLTLIVCIAFAASIFAQDIIVKKDGSTIRAKVEKVTSTEVEYKKASNPDGPTYTISIADLTSINYQNGSSDVFTSNVPQAEVVTGTGFITDETASRYSNDQLLVSQYQFGKYESYKKKAKIWKLSGLIGGSALAVFGTILGICSYNDTFNDALGDIGSYKMYYSLAGLGVVGGVTCYLIGNHYSKKASAARSLIGFDHNFGDGSNLSFGLEAMGTYYNPGVGVGVRYNF